MIEDEIKNNQKVISGLVVDLKGKQFLQSN